MSAIVRKIKPLGSAVIGPLRVPFVRAQFRREWRLVLAQFVLALLSSFTGVITVTVSFMIITLASSGSPASGGMAAEWLGRVFRAIASEGVAQLQVLGAVLLAATSLKSAGSVASSVLNMRLRMRFSVFLQDRIIRKLHDDPRYLSESASAGSIISTLFTEEGRFSKLLQTYPRLVLTGITLLVYTVALALLSKTLVLLLLGLCVAVALAMIPLNRRSRKIARQLTERARTYSEQTYDVLNSLRVAVYFNRQDRERNRFVEELRGIQSLELHNFTIHELIPQMSELVMGAVLSLILILGPVLLGAQASSVVSAVVALVVLAAQYFPYFIVLNSDINRMVASAPAVEVISEFFGPDGGAEEEPPPGSDIRDLESAVEFRNVCFDYRPRSNFEIRDLSFRVERGTTTLLFGPSGSGKSTIVEMVLGVLHPHEGGIFVDGRPLKDISKTSWRRLVGVAGQNTLFLANRSILENIAYGLENPDPAAVEDAARLSGAGEFIEVLPQKYGTEIRENGMNLSGGQRQRLHLSRALAIRPRVLILDEAMSGLDKESERGILKKLQEKVRKEGLTLILITHSLDYADRADKILVIEKGRLVQSGTHEALVSAGGPYAAQWAASRQLIETDR